MLANFSLRNNKCTGPRQYSNNEEYCIVEKAAEMTNSNADFWNYKNRAVLTHTSQNTIYALIILLFLPVVRYMGIFEKRCFARSMEVAMSCLLVQQTLRKFGTQLEQC